MEKIALQCQVEACRNVSNKSLCVKCEKQETNFPGCDDSIPPRVCNQILSLTLPSLIPLHTP